MAKSKIVSEFGNDYKVTQFFDSTLNYSGVDVSLDGEHLGEIVGLEIPDVEDIEENAKFDNEVVIWIVDNEK